MTPTPWNVDGGYGTCVERDAEGERIHIADCIDSEHARHIVRCVNAHEGLVHALTQALHYIENHPRTDSRGDLVSACIATGYAVTARAALAKAAS